MEDNKVILVLGCKKRATEKKVADKKQPTPR